jgi:hypothetical protein
MRLQVNHQPQTEPSTILVPAAPRSAPLELLTAARAARHGAHVEYPLIGRNRARLYATTVRRTATSHVASILLSSSS